MVPPVKLQIVAKNDEDGKYLRIPKWCFAVAEAMDDGSGITKRHLEEESTVMNIDGNCGYSRELSPITLQCPMLMSFEHTRTERSRIHENCSTNTNQSLQKWSERKWEAETDRH
jgi:hypothetical protein